MKGLSNSISYFSILQILGVISWIYQDFLQGLLYCSVHHTPIQTEYFYSILWFDYF